MEEKRGCIGFFTTNRPAAPLDIYSRPVGPTTTPEQDELSMTDGNFSNYNGQEIPKTALNTLLKHPTLASKANENDVDLGRVSGMVFVSERTDNLETLHFALRFRNEDDSVRVEVFNLAELLGTFKGARMEDSGCFAGEYLIYVSTKDPAPDRHQPWTAVYRTHLKTGETDRITPPFQADLSPSVSPCGKMIAVASFQKRGGWNGETESLETDIFVINIDRKPFHRTLVVKNGSWPSWGSKDYLFFHHKDKVNNRCAVFLADIGKVLEAEVSRVTLNKIRVGADISNPTSAEILRVTPEDVDAMTPAAISATKVAVSTISKDSNCRHIEIFDVTRPQEQPTQLTYSCKPNADHFNPFVILDNTSECKRIGYHRCMESEYKVPRRFEELKFLQQDEQQFRVSGMLPAFSTDGTKLAFVDNTLKNVWLAHSKEPLRLLYKAEDLNKVFSIVWNQNPGKDTLYVCTGPSCGDANDTVHIWAIVNASSEIQSYFPFYPYPSNARYQLRLTKAFNNAFPSTSPDGKKLVFQSARDDGQDKRYKNLYIIQDAHAGERRGKRVTRLTKGPWVDTHCQWSPRGNWIVFSSNRDSYEDAPPCGGLVDDLGNYGVYLVKANSRDVVVRAIASGTDIAGHVKNPFFSPDAKSIVVTSNFAALSVDPISLPLRSFGEIFTFEIDPDNIQKNKDVKKFKRITHSRFGNTSATWTMLPTGDPNAAWNLLEEPKPLPHPKLKNDLLAGNVREHLAMILLVASVLLYCPSLIPYAIIFISIVIVPMAWQWQ